MRKFAVLLSFFLCVQGLCIQIAFAMTAENKTTRQIATVTPIAHSMASALLHNTKVKVAYLPPKRLPINRIPSWIHKTQTKKYSPYDAFISIGAARSDLDYALTLRQTNIRIVTIDIAYALLPKGERVVTVSPQDYFWLNSNNALLMLGILKRDLALLWPDLKADIESNFHDVSLLVKRTNLEMEDMLRQHDIAALSPDNSSLNALAGSMSVDVMSIKEAKEWGLNTLTVSRKKLSKKRRTETSKPDSELTEKVLSWHIDDFSRFSKKSFKERLKQNFSNLKKSLGTIN